jgi:nucleotide-binding universal stress UspA family protein
MPFSLGERADPRYPLEGHVMLRSLLVGIDGTDDGGAALAMGIDWARRFNASVTGIGIVDELGISVPEPALFAEAYYHQAPGSSRPGNRQRIEAALQQFARRCEEAGVAGRTLTAGGLACEQIIEEARNHDLTLLGQQTHFYDGWEDRCDETLHNVLSGSPHPVVVVPKARTGGEFVVVAFDGSAQAIRALEAFEATVLDRSREIHVVSVAIDRAGASRYADAAVESLRSRGIDASAHPVATLRPAAGPILDEVHRLNAGLIVMGTYGQPAVREFFIGSVTSAILKESDVPIFCFH